MLFHNLEPTIHEARSAPIQSKPKRPRKLPTWSLRKRARLGVMEVFFPHFLAAFEHEFARLRAQASELKLCDPILKIESVVYRNVRQLGG